MSLTTFSDIPRSVLALLLDGVGKPQGMSPRLIMGEPGTIGPQERAQLYAGGFIEIPDKPTVRLTPQFVQVARVLLDPHTNVTIRIWGKDSICGETNVQFPRDIISGDGVILNQLGRMYRISAFIDDATITKMLGEAIPQPKEQDLEFEFDALLDNTVAAILFAVVDMARAEAAKKPEPVLNMVFNIQDVYSHMFDRWTFTGFKDLITYIAAVGIMPEPPSLTDTVDGLRLLATAGILKEKRTDSYSLTKAIEPLVRLAVGQPSGVQWQRISLLDNGDQVISNRMFLFGDRTLMLCLAPATKGRIYISRVRRKEITDFLLDELTASLFPARESPAAPEEVMPPPIVSKAPLVAAAVPSSAIPPPAAMVPPAVRQAPPAARPAPIPAQPARPAQPTAQPAPPLTCANCGASVAPGQKFCAKCGMPVASGRTAPVAPTACPNCGAALKTGAKFCSNCGAKL